MSLLCLLEGLLGLVLLGAVLWVCWWAITSILTAFGVGMPAQLAVLLKVAAVLILVIIIVRAAYYGEVCGFFAWSPALRR